MTTPDARSASTDDDIHVEHDARARRFVVRLPAGTAFLAYAPAGDGVIDLQHTVVPPEEQGHGLASRLAQAAFAHARAEGLRVIPTCPFVSEWLAGHPDQQDLVAER